MKTAQKNDIEKAIDVNLSALKKSLHEMAKRSQEACLVSEQDNQNKAICILMDFEQQLVEAQAFLRSAVALYRCRS